MVEAYAADPACALALSKASTADEKRAVLTSFGWTCTVKKNKSGSRWEYKKDGGRSVSSLQKIVDEISADGVADEPEEAAPAEADAPAEEADAPAAADAPAEDAAPAEAAKKAAPTSRSLTPAELALLQKDDEAGGATTPVEGDDPPKRKEKGADAKKAAALAFFSTVGPPELLKDIDESKYDELSKLLGSLPSAVAKLVGEDLGAGLKRQRINDVGNWLLSGVTAAATAADEAKREKLPEGLAMALGKLEADCDISAKTVLPAVWRDLVTLPEDKALSAVDQFLAGSSKIRNATGWLRAKCAQLRDGGPPPSASGDKPEAGGAGGRPGVDRARTLLGEALAAIGRHDLLDGTLDAALHSLSDDAAVAYATYVRSQPGQVLWGLGPGLGPWLLEGIRNGASQGGGGGAPPGPYGPPGGGGPPGGPAYGGGGGGGKPRPNYDDDRLCSGCRDVFRDMYDDRKMDKYDLDDQTVGLLSELSRAGQIEIAEHFAAFPRHKIKNLCGWLQGGIKRLLGKEADARRRGEDPEKRERSGRARARSRSPRSRSRSRGRRRGRSRSRSNRRRRSRSRSASPKKKAPSQNEAFFAKLEGAISVGDDPDAAQFAELATLVGGMSATCAEKAGKSLGRRVRRGKVKRVGAWLLASAKRFLAERDPARVKHPQPLEDAMHRLRSSRHLKKADFASGTLRDLTLLLPPNAALHVVDGLHSALESDTPPRDVDEALDDAISARLAAAGDEDRAEPPAPRTRAASSAGGAGGDGSLPAEAAKALEALEPLGVSAADLGEENLDALKTRLGPKDAAQVLELLHLSLSKRRSAPGDARAWVKTAIDKHVAKKDGKSVASGKWADNGRKRSRSNSPRGREKPRKPPAADPAVDVPPAVTAKWAALAADHDLPNAIPAKVRGDLGKLLAEAEAVDVLDRFGRALNKDRKTDAARFIFNEARKVYYARKDRSSSPGAPAKKRSKPLAGFKPPDKSPDREPAEADAPAEETAEEKEQRERATSDADHKLDALLDG